MFYELAATIFQVAKFRKYFQPCSFDFYQVNKEQVNSYVWFKDCGYLNIYYLEHAQANGNRNENYSHPKQVSASNNMEGLDGYVLPCPHNYLTLLEKDFEENTYHSIPFSSSVSNALNNTVSNLALY